MNIISNYTGVDLLLKVFIRIDRNKRGRWRERHLIQPKCIISIQNVMLKNQSYPTHGIKNFFNGANLLIQYLISACRKVGCGVDWKKIYFLNLLVSLYFYEYFGAQKRTRTSTPCSTDTWNLRVYQFRHLGIAFHLSWQSLTVNPNFV